MLGNDQQQRKANQILGLIREGIGTKTEKRHCTIVVCPYCTCWSSPLRKAKLGLEKVQRWVAGQTKGMGHLSHEEYVSRLGLSREVKTCGSKGK